MKKDVAFVEGMLTEWTLRQDEWESWRDRYLKGEAHTCLICEEVGFAVLRPLARVVSFECGHIMELPGEVPP